MKRKYSRPICLDTCIFNNIIGFDGEDSDFSKLYNKERLLKYIKHHGYNVSDCNLYETLRRDDWNEEKVINNLLTLNSKTLYKLKSIKPEVDELIKQKPNTKSRNNFIKTMFNTIVDFASEFYSEILIYPFLFVLYSTLYYYKSNKIYFSNNIISRHVDNIISFIKTNLEMEFSVCEKYTKSNAQKVLNKYYLIINHITIEWANTTANQLYEKITTTNISKENELYNIIVEYFNRLNLFDFTQNVLVEDGRTKATNADNLIYLLYNQEYIRHQDQYSKSEWILKFSQFLKNIFNVLYDSRDINIIVKTYYEMNVADFYIQHIIRCNERQCDIKFLDLIDPNDVIDLCALNNAYEQGYIYITNDSKINKVINKIYSKDQKEFVNLFINYQFD